MRLCLRVRKIKNPQPFPLRIEKCDRKWLTEKQKEKFGDYINEMQSVTERDAFSYGFRLDVRLMKGSLLLSMVEDE